MRTLNRCTLLALAAGFAAAEPIHAQDTLRVPQQNPQNPQARTHTVVRGDNLWDLSQTYLGNAFLWPEIYRLNRDVVEDPHWIYPGEILRLPGGDTTSVAVAVVPNVNVPALPTETQSVTTTMLPVDPGSATVFSRAPAAAPVAPAQVSGGPTSNNVMVNALPAPPTVRWGEVLAAPYVDREGGPRAFGRIHKSADLTGVAEAADRFRFQAYDKVYLSPPVGYVAPEGERYLAVRMGPLLRDQGQIIIPTGIVEVTHAARSGTAATGKVVRNYAGVAATDRLIPIDTAGVGSNIRPVRVDGPTTKISWVYGEPVLPSIGGYVILEATSRNGVRMGDEFTIYKPAQRDRSNLPIDPEILIAKLQVVRSTPYGVTAVVVGQAQPAIKNGAPARLTAKMP